MSKCEKKDSESQQLETTKMRLLVERVQILEGQLKMAESELSRMLSSTSWRLTRPLRAIRHRFFGNLFRKRISCVHGSPQEENIPSGGKVDEPFNTENEADKLRFDAEFYRKAYPDTNGLDPWYHYTNYGRKEGRFACAQDAIFPIDLKGIDQAKATVLIVSHEATRTGAPVLALNIAQELKEKYNVVVLLLKGGGLQAIFEAHLNNVLNPFKLGYTPYSVSAFLTSLTSVVKPKFAIVNSIESRSVLPVLANFFVPTLCLVHEFASTRPGRAILEVFLYASRVVFSADIVYKDAAVLCDSSKVRPIILPQGKCVIPRDNIDVERKTEELKRITKIFRPHCLPADARVILGVGSVEYRKGVDLFLACAARIRTLFKDKCCHFIWIGNGFDPEKDKEYSAYLQNQIDRAGLEKQVCFAGEIIEVDAAYQLSDILFLSSRLDPLPNVAIDAMFNEIPVICFDGTTGIADILRVNGLGDDCVVPYLDVEQAAQKIARIMSDPASRKILGQKSKDIAQKTFDMKSYVEALELHALDCAPMLELEEQEGETLEESKILNHGYYTQPAWADMAYKDTIRAFVRSWKSGVDLRKPFPGFHPGIYEDVHGVSAEQKNALVDFIENGRPAGSWLCELIEPLPSIKDRIVLPVRAALHVHVFFVELFQDFFKRLAGQNIPLDLLISVPSEEIAGTIRSMVEAYRHGIDIRVVPNKGRDLGPLLTEFREKIYANYEVIGHVHTKRSGDVKDSAVGKTWYTFLLENLVGGKYPMASIIIERFVENTKLGLVFPDDPFVVGWTKNKDAAEELGKCLDLGKLPDRHFNFPVGSMFWARTEALKPLWSMKWKWEDYPEEPLPYDGTVLHAIERLIPSVAEKMGYQTMMSHVPGITR